MPAFKTFAKALAFGLVTVVWHESIFVAAVNPIIQTRYTTDPAPMVWNNTLYLFADHDNDNAITGFNMTDWRLYSTTDMVNWLDLGSPLALKDFAWANANAWAPQTIERNGKFYMYTAVQQTHGNMAVGVAVSDRIEGPYKDPLGKALVATSTGNIDPTVFIDDDGQAYLYTGNPLLYYVKLNEDMISYSGGVQNVSLTIDAFGKRPGFLFGTNRLTTYEEGPWFYKRNGIYYLAYAANCCPEDIRYSISDTPTGPWHYQGLIMPVQGGNFGNHPGIIDYKGRSYLFYFNQGIPNAGRYDRTISVEEFKYGGDGSIPTVTMTYEGPDQIGTLNPYQRVEAETIANSFELSTAPSDQGTQMINGIQDGSWLMVQGVDFGPGSGATQFHATVASASQGGNIELRLGSITGKLIGTVEIGNTGGWTTWKTISAPLKGAKGLQNVYMVFTGSHGPMFNFDYWSFSKK